MKILGSIALLRHADLRERAILLYRDGGIVPVYEDGEALNAAIACAEDEVAATLRRVWSLANHQDFLSAKEDPIYQGIALGPEHPPLAWLVGPQQWMGNIDQAVALVQRRMDEHPDLYGRYQSFSLTPYRGYLRGRFHAGAYDGAYSLDTLMRERCDGCRLPTWGNLNEWQGYRYCDECIAAARESA